MTDFIPNHFGAIFGSKHWRIFPKLYFHEFGIWMPDLHSAGKYKGSQEKNCTLWAIQIIVYGSIGF
jgi:hypothetical protein